MLRFPVQDAIVTIDLEHPSVGMGQGAIELQSGSTRVNFPFQVISETAVHVTADQIMAGAAQALKDNDIALSPVRVLGAN